ncbi:MAG: hypothetical protein HYW80_00960, partial [Parcubacteria group bacterium]|nr:hypothetical protein [Parcubacteria group bacterium]
VSYGKIYHFYDDDPSVLYRNDKPAYSGNIFREILRQNFINVLTVLVRKEFLDRHGAFPQGWRACDEHFLWSNLAFHGVEFSYLNEVVGLERLHRTSDSRRRDHVFDTADRVLAMLSMFEKEFTPEEKAKYKTDIVSLRKRWYKVLAVGKLLASPFFSWFLMPLYLRRRNNQYKKIINNSK